MPYKDKGKKAAWQRENDGDAQRVIDYDRKHPDKARARRKRYRLLNAAKVRESQRKWRHANRGVREVIDRAKGVQK